jgi:hypothetical protein
MNHMFFLFQTVLYRNIEVLLELKKNVTVHYGVLLELKKVL